jgi:hypothetical protein
MIGWVQVQSHEVAHVLHEKGIGRKLEGLGAVRLQVQGSQMRETVTHDSLVARAMERALQWVAVGGVDSRVRVIRFCTWTSLISRGAPGRYESACATCTPWLP